MCIKARAHCAQIDNINGNVVQSFPNKIGCKCGKREGGSISSLECLIKYHILIFCVRLWLFRVPATGYSVSYNQNRWNRCCCVTSRPGRDRNELMCNMYAEYATNLWGSAVLTSQNKLWNFSETTLSSRKRKVCHGCHMHIAHRPHTQCMHVPILTEEIAKRITYVHRSATDEDIHRCHWYGGAFGTE